jgi:hypothetical protein
MCAPLQRYLPTALTVVSLIQIYIILKRDARSFFVIWFAVKILFEFFYRLLGSKKKVVPFWAFRSVRLILGAAIMMFLQLP